MRAQEWLRQRPGQLERLEDELNSGDWTRRLYLFSASDVALASATDQWNQIDRRLRSMVSNWSDDQLAVIPLPPIAQLEVALIETQAPVVANTLRQASTVGAAPLVEVPANAPRHAATVPAFSMKKAALIEQHKHEWPTIAGDIAGAKRNGLSAAKAGARGWREVDAIEWARNNGKLQSTDKPGDLLASGMHKMSDLPARRYK